MRQSKSLRTLSPNSQHNCCWRQVSEAKRAKGDHDAEIKMLEDAVANFLKVS